MGFIFIVIDSLKPLARVQPFNNQEKLFTLPLIIDAFSIKFTKYYYIKLYNEFIIYY